MRTFSKNAKLHDVGGVMLTVEFKKALANSRLIQSFFAAYLMVKSRKDDL